MENLWWLLAGERSKQSSAVKGTIKKAEIKEKELYLGVNSPASHHSPTEALSFSVERNKDEEFGLRLAAEAAC